MSYCSFPMPAHTCWDDCSKRPSSLWPPRQAPASCFWDRGRHASSHKPMETPLRKFVCSPGRCCRLRPQRAMAPGNHGLARRQILPAEGRRRWPGFRTKTLRSGKSRYSLRNCTRICCPDGHTHMSCVEPRRPVICLRERVEPPDSGAIRHSAIRTSCSREWSGPAKLWQSSRTTCSCTNTSSRRSCYRTPGSGGFRDASADLFRVVCRRGKDSISSWENDCAVRQIGGP